VYICGCPTVSRRKHGGCHARVEKTISASQVRRLPASRLLSLPLHISRAPFFFFFFFFCKCSILTPCQVEGRGRGGGASRCKLLGLLWLKKKAENNLHTLFFSRSGPSPPIAEPCGGLQTRKKKKKWAAGEKAVRTR